MEAHPYSAMSHLSALAFHGLTDMLSKELVVSIPQVALWVRYLRYHQHRLGRTRSGARTLPQANPGAASSVDSPRHRALLRCG